MKLIKCSCCIIFLLTTLTSFAQDDEKRGFRKDNLFTGGSIAFSFFNQSFLIGGNPVFGYSLSNWADVGLVGNYTYTAYKDYIDYDDKLKQSVYGGGVFARLFPVRFLFAQGQIEHNEIRLKYVPAPGSGRIRDSYSESVASVLVGAGYTTGRDADAKNAYAYLAILFDISGNRNSPYVDNAGRALPILRAGVHIPLFQRSR